MGSGWWTPALQNLLLITSKNDILKCKAFLSQTQIASVDSSQCPPLSKHVAPLCEITNRQFIKNDLETTYLRPRGIPGPACRKIERRWENRRRTVKRTPRLAGVKRYLAFGLWIISSISGPLSSVQGDDGSIAADVPCAIETCNCE